MDHFSTVSAEDIERNLQDLKQLTFEVTDACNLKCKYCAYGEMYTGYDVRESKFLSVEKAKCLIDYLAGLWSRENKLSLDQKTYISFYGGEPLLNMPFIREIKDYAAGLTGVSKRFRFNMTTNAVLLDRYMDYLAANDFQILISLDGDREGHSYRVDHAG